MRNLIYIIVIAALTFCNFAYAGSSANSVNSNLNNNKNNNANINALIPIYNSDTSTTVTNSHITETKIPVGSAHLPTIINNNNSCVRTIGIGGNGQYASGIVSIPIESSFCQGQLLAAKFPRYSPMWWGIMCQEKKIRKADKISKGGNCPVKKGWKVEGPLEQKKCKYPSPDCKD